MKHKLHVITGFILAIAILASALGAAALAANETDTAAAYLVEHGIFEGDENGNLNLDKSLTRAELAAILTRLDFAATPGGLAEWRDWGAAHFSDPENRYNKFTDIPNWAMPYVEYCYQRGLMKGVAETNFDAQGKVNPRMACTVILRYCGVAETDWEYNSSVEKARIVGLAPGAGLDGDVIPRGTMAVILYRGINYAESGTVPGDTPTATPSPSPQVTPAMTIDEMKAEIVRLTNEARAQSGLNPLEDLPELTDCAQAKAQDFIDNHYYGHNSPKYGTPGEMIISFVPNAKSYAENIASWTKTPENVIVGLMDSPEHKANILTAKLTHIGVGIVEGADGGYWWVQHFVRL
jgi:uncharacterized protein YkwD